MHQTLVKPQDIEVGLQRLRLARGATVEVHSSLRAFGRVEGGAEAIINALIRTVGSQGTIVMSAYPVSPAVPLSDEERARGITWKVRKLSEDSTERTGMGVVADTFRQRPDVICGTGPFRTCAWGRDAEWQCHGYHGLLAVDGWCLLLGVGIDRCSSMHAAEYVRLPAEIEAYWAVPEEIQRAYDPSVWSIGYGSTPHDAWQKVFEEADRRGLIRQGQIGQARCYLFKARTVVSIYRDWRQTDAYGLYGAEPATA